MAHKTEASREYPLPRALARIIYNYYFDAPAISANYYEFYALCVDGTLYVHDTTVLQPHTKRYTDIENIEISFALGVVHRYGRKFSFGRMEQWQPKLDNLDLSKVDALFSNYTWFAALMKDKTVQTWPSKDASHLHRTEIDSKKLEGVVRIYSTNDAFAALKSDGTVVTWGDTERGGDSSGVKKQLTEVKDIFNTHAAFAALKKDGTVVTWGENSTGGDSRVVSKELKAVVDICGTSSSFAARRLDGSVVTWGENSTGGDSSKVSKELAAGVVHICPTSYAFVARTGAGGLVTWGGIDIGALEVVQRALGSQPVKHLYSNGGVFTAIAGTTAVTWNPRFCLMNITEIGNLSPLRVVSIQRLFLATNANGDAVVWGEATRGVGYVGYALEYARMLNEHQLSIRAAFKIATGME